MSKIIYGTFILLCIMISLASAVDYSPHKQNTLLQFAITSNNATQCNVTTMTHPLGVVYINQIMTKNGNTFNSSVVGGNFSNLGSYCFNLVCTDGINIETGSLCREVTPSGFVDTLGFYIILLAVLGGVIILGFSIKEVWFVVIGGLGFMMLGIYSINYGIVGFRDMFMTWGIGLFEIGIGTVLSVGAAWEKLDMD